MRVKLRRFEPSDATSIDRLNERLEAAGIKHRLWTEDLSLNPTADLDVMPITDSLFVADDGEIRGGSWLREQYFWIDGDRHRVSWMKYPVSESLVDPQYAGVPASMLLQLLRKQPNMMALGLGGHEAPFARLLAGVGWKSASIPFRFRIVRPFRVLRGLTYARRRWWIRAAMDVAAWTGAGWIVLRVLHALDRESSRNQLSVTTEPRFTPWADPIWEACRGSYGALAIRDGRTLDTLYPPSFPKLDRLRVSREGSDIGWVCAQVLPSSPDVSEYFGDLSVGVLTDALARPSDAATVLSAGSRHLERLGVDLIVTYLSHTAWLSAAHRLRFLPGPSNVAFYRSPQADALLLDGAPLSERCHLTRSDCDGPKQ